MIWRVRDRTTFVALRRAGHRGRGGAVTVTYLAEASSAPPRVAFVIPKAVGTAVTRNRLRRQCRAYLTGDALAADVALRPGAYLVRVGPTVGDGPALRADLAVAVAGAHRLADAARVRGASVVPGQADA